MTEETIYYGIDVNYTLPLVSNNQITYNDIVSDLGDQMMTKILIIGVVFLCVSYWDRCGMRKDWCSSGKSYPKLLMIYMFGNQAEEKTKDMNEILDGLTSTLSFICIAMYILYKLGV